MKPFLQPTHISLTSKSQALPSLAAWRQCLEICCPLHFLSFGCLRWEKEIYSYFIFAIEADISHPRVFKIQSLDSDKTNCNVWGKGPWNCIYLFLLAFHLYRTQSTSFDYSVVNFVQCIQLCGYLICLAKFRSLPQIPSAPLQSACTGPVLAPGDHWSPFLQDCLFRNVRWVDSGLYMSIAAFAQENASSAYRLIRVSWINVGSGLLLMSANSL